MRLRVEKTRDEHELQLSGLAKFSRTPPLGVPWATESPLQTPYGHPFHGWSRLPSHTLKAQLLILLSQLILLSSSSSFGSHLLRWGDVAGNHEALPLSRQPLEEAEAGSVHCNREACNHAEEAGELSMFQPRNGWAHREGRKGDKPVRAELN